MTKTRTGVLHLYSETGTEGGWWAFQDEEFITPAPDKSLDKVCKSCRRIWLNYKTNDEPSPECYDNGHSWEDFGPYDSWSYEGLITLQNGDVLDVFDKDGKQIAETITVKLKNNYDQYAPGAKHARGMVIHHYPDPKTIDFEKWNDYFFEQRKCVLHREEKVS